MTGEQLKDQLTRIAEAAPEIHVPDDLFARGRRATARARATAAGATVASIVLIASVTTPFLLTDDAQVADEDGRQPGVPEVIYTPPDGSTTDLPNSSLDEIGPLVAAYPADPGDGTTVVVDTTGRYLTVRLPDRWQRSDAGWPQLSPDGRQLAYASLRDLELGVSIVDLTSGEIREVALGSTGAQATTLQWSPDGRWLAWSGQVVRQARQSGVSFYPGTVAGVIAPGATSSRPEWTGNRWQGLGVCDDGTALRYVWPVFFAQDGPGERRIRSWPRLVQAHGSCSAPRSFVAAEGRLLGWLEGSADDPSATAVVQSQRRVALVWPGNAREKIIRIESDGGIELTLATGLMTADQPTVPAGESPWAPSWWEAHRSDLFILAVFVAAPWMLFLFIRRRLRK